MHSRGNLLKSVFSLTCGFEVRQEPVCVTRNEITRRQRKSSRSSNNNKSSSFKWTAKGLSYSYTSIGYTPISNKKFFFF